MMSEIRGFVFFKTGVKITLIILRKSFHIMLYNTKKRRCFRRTPISALLLIRQSSRTKVRSGVSHNQCLDLGILLKHLYSLSKRHLCLFA